MKLVKRESGFNGLKCRDAKKFFFDNYKKGLMLNVSATAKELGVTRQTIHNWIKTIENK